MAGKVISGLWTSFLPAPLAVRDMVYPQTVSGRTAVAGRRIVNAGRRPRMNAPPSRRGAERSDEPAVQIGALVPLARPGWVEAGRHLLAGLELGVSEVNEAGGIGGSPLGLVIRDTAPDPQRATAAVDELTRLGVA